MDKWHCVSFFFFFFKIFNNYLSIKKLCLKFLSWKPWLIRIFKLYQLHASIKFDLKIPIFFLTYIYSFFIVDNRERERVYFFAINDMKFSLIYLSSGRVENIASYLLILYQHSITYIFIYFYFFKNFTRLSQKKNVISEQKLYIWFENKYKLIFIVTIDW